MRPRVGAPWFAARGRTNWRAGLAVRVPPVAIVEANRRLAVILAADIVGYSRLMALDEDGTVQTLATYQEVIAALVAEHHGPDLQSRRRRHHGRVRQRGAGGALRGGDPAHGRAPQRRPRRGPAGGVPDRPQSGRRGGARRRSARRRRQCRGAAAGVGRARADLHLGGGARADRGQGGLRLRVARRAQPQAHRAAGPRLRGRLGAAGAGAGGGTAQGRPAAARPAVDRRAAVRQHEPGRRSRNTSPTGSART